jgi:hypothetical protein
VLASSRVKFVLPENENGIFKFSFHSFSLNNFKCYLLETIATKLLLQNKTEKESYTITNSYLGSNQIKEILS